MGLPHVIPKITAKGPPLGNLGHLTTISKFSLLFRPLHVRFITLRFFLPLGGMASLQQSTESLEQQN